MTGIEVFGIVVCLVIGGAFIALIAPPESVGERPVKTARFSVIVLISGILALAVVAVLEPSEVEPLSGERMP